MIVRKKLAIVLFVLLMIFIFLLSSKIFTSKHEVYEGSTNNINDIKTNNFPGHISAGIKLGPDGTQFLRPAILTVTPLNSSEISMIFTGDENGSNLEITCENDNISSSALIITSVPPFILKMLKSVKNTE